MDTNLIVLLCVGRVSREEIPRNRRTKTFTPTDYDLLTRIIEYFPNKATTPNILTEASNLLLDKEDRKYHAEYSTELTTQIGTIPEEYVRSSQAVTHNTFSKFGLTDAVLYLLSEKGYVLLSVDAALVAYATRFGLKAINFNYIRTPSLLE